MSGLTFESAVQKLEVHIKNTPVKGERWCSAEEYEIVLVALMCLKNKETPTVNIKRKLGAVYKKVFGSYPFNLTNRPELIMRDDLQAMPPEERAALTQEDLGKIIERIENAVFTANFPIRDKETSFLNTCSRYIKNEFKITPAQRKWLLDIHDRLGEFEEKKKRSSDWDNVDTYGPSA